MKLMHLVLFVLVMSAGIQISSAQVITMNPIATGTYSIQTGSPSGTPPGGYAYDGGYGPVVGEHYAPGGSVDIMTFQIPTLPTGDVFTTVNLRLQLLGIVNNGNLSNGDLYALSVTSAPVVDGPTQYYQGAAIDPSATLIEQNLLTPSSPTRTDADTGPFIFTSSTADAALAAYLNANDIDNAAAGKYLTLRVSYDQSPISGYNTYTLLGEAAGGPNEKPLLTLNYALAPVVPEPSTYAMFGLGALVLFYIARKRALRSL